MARVRGDEAAGVYGAAQRFVERALRANGSIFSSRRRWAPDLIDDLHERLSGVDGRTFAERWAAALHDASPAVVELAAETLYVHLLFAADLAPATKHGLVEGTLARSPAPPPISPPLTAALDGGLARTGVAFKTRRTSQLALLLAAVGAWKGLRPAERRERLDDPDAFKRWLFAVPHDGAHAQREALLHLVHPDAFEAIVSPRMKRRFVERHGGPADRRAPDAGVDVPDGIDVDVALRAIRRRLAARHGEGFAFIDLAASSPA